MRSQLGPDVTDGTLTDLTVLMLGGNGLKNVDYYMSDYMWNDTKIFELEDLYIQWRGNRSRYDFFFYVMNNFSYKCEEMFLSCSLGAVKLNCCETFKQTYVMNRGKCFSTNELHQADADEIGKLSIKIKELPSIAMSNTGFQVGPRFLLALAVSRKLFIMRRALLILAKSALCVSYILLYYSDD